MATSTTYNGKPKPLGKSGHYYESRRHALQAKGIKTGNIAEQTPEPILDLGLLPNNKEQDKELEQRAAAELEATPEPEITYEPLSVGAEEIEIEDGEVEVKKPSHSIVKDVIAGWQKEKKLKNTAFLHKAYEEVGAEEPEEDYDEEEAEFTGAPMQFGKIIADLFGDYDANNLAGLNDQQLETLAIKHESAAEGMFLKPSNPFIEELKHRIVAREKIHLEKEKLDAELEPTRMRIRQEIADIRKRAQSGDRGDILDRIWNM